MSASRRVWSYPQEKERLLVTGEETAVDYTPLSHLSHGLVFVPQTQ